MQILVTRPAGKGQSLVEKLQAINVGAFHQPVLTIEAGPDLPIIAQRLAENRCDILIFISTFAVDYFISAIKDPLLLNRSGLELMAVGQSTANKLSAWADSKVLAPPVETTEGLLNLPQLKQVSGKNIVICRGVGGRELLAESLRERGAEVDYWQLYQRVEIDNQGEYWFEQWQAKEVDCIVVTSVAILQAIFAQLPLRALPWLQSRKWIAASGRIVECAINAGVAANRITDARGASDEAIVAQVKQLIER